MAQSRPTNPRPRDIQFEFYTPPTPRPMDGQPTSFSPPTRPIDVKRFVFYTPPTPRPKDGQPTSFSPPTRPSDVKTLLSPPSEPSLDKGLEAIGPACHPRKRRRLFKDTEGDVAIVDGRTVEENDNPEDIPEIGDDEINDSCDEEEQEEQEEEKEKAEDSGLDPSLTFVNLAQDLRSKFIRGLWHTIANLISEAKSIKWDQWRDSSEKPFSAGNWRLLNKTSCLFLMKLFVPGIVQEVVPIFEKPKFEDADLKSLPSADKIRGQVVYINIATGEMYVGSTDDMQNRLNGDSGHLTIAKKKVENLRKELRTLHYKYICQPDVSSEFKVLAFFEEPIHKGYLQLLEGIFMVMFKTYGNGHRHVHMWAPLATYTLVDTLRSFLELPSATWAGLNDAWPLYQGFKNGSGKKPSPCAMKCGRMIYHEAYITRSDGKKVRTRRYCYDPLDPLGSYICNTCYYRRRKARLANRPLQLPAPGSFSIEQLQLTVLRNQIAAFEFLAKNTSVPLALQMQLFADNLHFGFSL